MQRNFAEISAFGNAQAIGVIATAKLQPGPREAPILPAIYGKPMQFCCGSSAPGTKPLTERAPPRWLSRKPNDDPESCRGRTP